MPITDLKGLPVFVTGGTGFIGRTLVRRLLAEGAVVTLLSRRGGGPEGARVIKGDVGDGARLGAVLAGQAVLFSLAYDVRQPGAANVAAFERLMEAAEAARVGRVVHLSSIVVQDGWPGGQESPGAPSPGGSPYRRAKIAEEARLMAGRLPALILQPTLVWGPGSALWTNGFADALLGGGIAVPEPEGLFQGVFVEDVATACLLAAAVPDPGRERFVINGPAAVPWSALLGGYRDILGRGTIRRVRADDLRPPDLRPPAPDRDAPDRPSLAARISAMGRSVLGTERFEALVRKVRSGRPMGELRPDAHLYELMTTSGDWPSTAARDRLGYLPAHDLAMGLAATAAALRKLAGNGAG